MLKYLALAALMAAAPMVGTGPALAKKPSLQWIASQSGYAMPKNAVYGGTNDDDAGLYICHVNYRGGVHPGKLYRGKCNFGFGGKEVVADAYEVLVGRAAWGDPARSGGIVGGYNDDGAQLLICRAYHKGGQHPGKLYRGNCNFGYGGKEIVSSSYELLYGN